METVQPQLGNNEICVLWDEMSSFMKVIKSTSALHFLLKLVQERVLFGNKLSCKILCSENSVFRL